MWAPTMRYTRDSLTIPPVRDRRGPSRRHRADLPADQRPPGFCATCPSRDELGADHHLRQERHRGARESGRGSPRGPCRHRPVPADTHAMSHRVTSTACRPAARIQIRTAPVAGRSGLDHMARVCDIETTTNDDRPAPGPQTVNAEDRQREAPVGNRPTRTNRDSTRPRPHHATGQRDLR